MKLAKMLRKWKRASANDKGDKNTNAERTRKGQSNK